MGNLDMGKRIVALNGRIIKRKCGTVLLRVYSKPLTKRILELGQRITLLRFRDGFTIKPDGSKHVTVVANKGLQIAITRLSREYGLEVFKTIPVYIDTDTWKIEFLLKKAIGIPITHTIPKKLIHRRAAITRKYNKYCLDITFKKLNKLSERITIRCLIKRVGDGFVIVKSNNLNARKLTPHSKRRIQISIPKSMLSKNEINFLSVNSWFKTKVKFDPDSFGLSLADFYTVKEENELVKAMIERGIKVVPKDYRAPYDILLKKSKCCIEVHNSLPVPEDFSSRHRIRPGQVRLRILEAHYNISKYNLKHSFVIINNAWKRSKHISSMNISNTRVHVIFTDFNSNWAEKTTQKILDVIGEN